jgi:hypothetical protein
MGRPQEGEVASRRAERMRYGPYGLAGHDLGGYALDLSIMLRAPDEQVPVAADNGPTWSEDDRHAFDTYVDFRRASDSVGLDHETSGNAFYSPDRWKRANELSRTVDLFHVALPFSEGERRWLLDYAMAFGFGRAPTGFELPDSISGTETTIISAGLRQVLKGRELVRRWAAWRRGVDEFAEQDTVDEARRHAIAIARRVLPKSDFQFQAALRAIRNHQFSE